MSLGEDFGINPLTEGLMGGGVLGMISEGFLSDSGAIALEAAITAEAERYLALLLAELPEDVYADSGHTEILGGVESPVELHKKFLLTKARVFGEVHVNLQLVALEANILTCSENTIGLYEDRYLGWRWEGEVLEARQQRVSRVYALNGGLSIPFLRARIFEIIGYYPVMALYTREEWPLGLDELGNETHLTGIWVTYRVDLATTESADIIDRIDRLLTRLEPARCSHVINNNAAPFAAWELGISALGLNTNLPV
jgi:hypothetical protein